MTYRHTIAALATAFLCSLPLCPNTALASLPHRHPPDEIVVDVKSTPEAEHHTTLRIATKDGAKPILKSKQEPLPAPVKYSDVTVSVRHDGQVRTYALTDAGELCDIAAGRKLVLPAAYRQKLSSYIEGVRMQHYGKLVPWNEADRLIPRKARITVLDLESGLSFRAQRRAGSSHADVQPLTKADTRIMKQIYGGRWSWNRRAVLVKGDGDWIAASMHGMPHGGDGIPDNDFNGHFCVHFYGSATHRSRQTDAAHQVMVFRAAGQLKPYLESRPPAELAQLYVIALHQQDPALLDKLVPASEGRPLHPFAGELDKLEMVKLISPLKQDDIAKLQQVDIPLQVAVYRKGSAQPEKNSLLITCRRSSLTEPWRIEHIAAEQK